MEVNDLVVVKVKEELKFVGSDSVLMESFVKKNIKFLVFKVNYFFIIIYINIDFDFSEIVREVLILKFL